MPYEVTRDKALKDRLVTIRRHLHQHPELSGEEQATAEYVCAQLDALGISYQSGIAGHGIVAELPGKVPAPFVALRADMDALPIQEQTGLDFTSTNEGVMHACAHDGHMAALLGAALLLKRSEPLALPIRLIFQPAEELAHGAQDMIAAGVLEDVAAIYGGHFDRHYRAGTIALRAGAVNASSDGFCIDIEGRGGHGSRPHETKDAVVVGTLLVIAIQTIVSREVDPAHPSVVTVGAFHAGTAPNVIAGSARLEGTIRAQDPAVRDQLIAAIKRIAASIGELHGAQVTTRIRHGTPPLINTEEQAHLASKAATHIVGTQNVLKFRKANMGGEDFAYYLQHIPGAYVRYGAQVEGREGFPAHSSRFDFSEDALPIASGYLARIAELAAEHYST